ncbi:MAG: hypothetical protein QW115_00190, partial [Thermoplasmata archaeon]
MDRRYKILIGAFAVLAVVLLLLVILHPAAQEEYVVVRVEDLPREFTWMGWKNVVVRVEGVSNATRVLFWCQGDGEFGAFGGINGKTVFVVSVRENRTFYATGLQKLRLERIEKFEPVELPDTDWKLCGNLVEDYFGIFQLRVKPGLVEGAAIGEGARIYIMLGNNITGYGKDGKVRERVFDGVVFRGGKGEKVHLVFERGKEQGDGDADADFVWDAAERELGLNATNPDSDGDGALDGVEVYWGTEPLVNDTDGDGVEDGIELCYVPLKSCTGSMEIPVEVEGFSRVAVYDARGDVEVKLGKSRILPLQEQEHLVFNFNALGGNIAISGNFSFAVFSRFGLNPFDADADLDGLSDSQEIEFGSSPILPDTEHDGLNDSKEYMLGTDPTSNDTDGDGIGDYEEAVLGLNPANPDTDNDLLPDGAEINYWNKTLQNATASALHCRNPDVDNDGMPDGWEIQNGLNLTSDDASGDADNDGLSNVGEWNLDANPKASDTDCDGLSDGAEVGNCSFRTNIAEGARSIGNYSNSSGWIWWNWSKYVFASENAWNETPELLFALGDGGIYINRTGNKLIIVSGLENGRVNTTHV